MKIYTSSILSILLFSCFGSFLHGQPTTYSNTSSYIVGDLVVSGSATYIAIAGSTGQTPPNTSYWSDLSVAATALNIPTEAVPTLDTQTILNSLPGFTPDGGVSSGASSFFGNFGVPRVIGSLDLIFMLFVTAMILGFMILLKRIGRTYGSVGLLLYVGYILYVFN